MSQAFSRGTKYFLVFYTIISLILTARHFYSYHASEGTDDDAAIFPRADENKAEIPLLNSSSSSSLSHSKNSSSQLQVDHQALAQSSDSSSHPDVAWPLDNGKKTVRISRGSRRVQHSPISFLLRLQPTHGRGLCTIQDLFRSYGTFQSHAILSPSQCTCGKE